MKKDFSAKVYEVVSKIPYGQVRSYREVAELAGRPLAWRVVGNALNKNYDSKIPCHRVIRSDGRAGGYNRGQTQKKEKLRREGVKI